jgi:acetoin utilization protein AcuC
MSHATAFIYSDEYLKYDFGPSHPFKPIRERYTYELLRKLGVFNEKAKFYEPKPASIEDLLLVHTKEYIQFVKEKCEKGIGFLDYGDTPALKGVYPGVLARVGGSLCAAKLVMQGKVSHAFNTGGGLHHAVEDRAAGFCVFNDVAITVRKLQKKYGLRRIAVIDIDGHHADGTQKILYREPVLKISLHRYGPFFFPGTGTVDEKGEGLGEGYCVNVPLPEGTYDEAYLYAFREIVPPLIEKYKPEILVNQWGVDGHFEDPLVGLLLTTTAFQEISLILHKLGHDVAGGRLIVLGGGGYVPENVARCWAVMFTTLSEALPKSAVEKGCEIYDKITPKKDELIFKRVKRIVEEVKRIIFPYHGLNP